MALSNYENRFLMVPVSALSDMCQERISILFDYALVEFAKKFQLSLKNAASELLYDWYHLPEYLTEVLHTTLTEIQANNYEVLNDEDYQGFNADGKYEPEELEEFIGMINAHSLQKLVKEYASIKKAQKLYGIKYRNADYIKHHHSMIKPKNKVFGKVPINVMWMVINCELSIEGFQMYVAVRSIEGNRKYSKTNKIIVGMRMSGAISKRELSQTPNRYQIDKTIQELKDLDLVRLVTGGRCWYVSTKLSDPELKIEVHKKLRQQPNFEELANHFPGVEVMSN
jgi:hypothetical protein